MRQPGREGVGPSVSLNRPAARQGVWDRGLGRKPQGSRRDLPRPPQKGGSRLNPYHSSFFGRFPGAPWGRFSGLLSIAPVGSCRSGPADLAPASSSMAFRPDLRGAFPYKARISGLWRPIGRFQGQSVSSCRNDRPLASYGLQRESGANPYTVRRWRRSEGSRERAKTGLTRIRIT